MVHVPVNKYDFEKINILEYAFGEGGGGQQKAYAVYAFINVDNYERPLSAIQNKSIVQNVALIIIDHVAIGTEQTLKYTFYMC